LGVLLYAMLCGKFPFKGHNDKELFKKIAHIKFDIPDRVSLSAKHLLLSLIKKEPL